MVRVAKIKFVEIYAGQGDVYVVYNTKKPFSDGHTHVKNFNTAKYLANLIVRQQIPRNCKSVYLLESFIRLETNPKRIHGTMQIIQKQTEKKRRH